MTLGDVTSAIVDCEHKTAPTQASGFPSIRTTDIKNGRLLLPQANRVSETIYKEWTARLEPQPEDLIMAREAPVGEVGIVPSGHRVCLGQRTVLVRPDKSKVVPRFLLYLLLTPDMRHLMISRAEGSITPHLNMSDIRALPIPNLPVRHEQQAIAELLGGLDDKIELNLRMNETLEAIARTIFKSWFVDFDPVRAKAKGHQPTNTPISLIRHFASEFVNSPAWLIAAGWDCKPLSDAFEINPRYQLEKNRVAAYVDMGNIPTVSARITKSVEREFTSGMRFSKGDTLVARITPCLENGKTAYVDFLRDGEVAWGSTEFIVLRPKAPLPPEYGYFLARSERFRAFAIGNMTGTSGRQRVPVDCFDNFYIAVPPEPIATAFGDLTRVFFQKMKQNDDESRSLSDLRDSLLPRLISGEIRIKQAAKLMEVHA